MLYIFTLNWNGASFLPKLIESVQNNLKQDYQWIIKDNGSNDNSIETISIYQNISVIARGHNRDNFAEGMNYIFRHANPNDSDIILLLNNDVEFIDSESINKMIKLLTNNVGGVGARLLYPDKTLQHAGVIFGERYGKLPYHYRHKEKSDKASCKNRKFQAVTAAVFLTKAEYFKNICQTNKSGNVGFDENYNWCFEDVDACLTIQNNMKKDIIYCGGTNIIHQESLSLQKNPINKIFMSQNVQYFKSKWWGKYKIDHDLYLKNFRYNET